MAALHVADVLEWLKRIQQRGSPKTAHPIRAKCNLVIRYEVPSRPQSYCGLARRNAAGAHMPQSSITELANIAELPRDIQGCCCRSLVVSAALRSRNKPSAEVTGHGLRSMASTLLNEWCCNHIAIARQLSHRNQNGARAAYSHAKCLPPCRKML